MSLLHPVRSALTAAEVLTDRLLCLFGAVVFSQAPEFMQQYLQRLGGHLDEARRQLSQFRDAAQRSGMTLDQFAHDTSSNSDAAVARLGDVILATRSRVATLSADEHAIRSAHVWSRPFVFLRHVDPSIAHATWAAFRPALPTTVEGALYAVVGMLLFLSCYHGAVRRPLRRAWARRQARRRGAGAALNPAASL